MERNLIESDNNQNITNERINKTIALLNHKIEKSDFNFDRNLTVFVGLTGSGKSTTCQLIVGNANLTAVVTEGGDAYISDGDEKISSYTLTSKTFYPELIRDPTSRNVLVDCPGFADTRSAEHDIAATVLTRNLLENADNVKVIIVTNENAVRQGKSRTEFIGLLEHVNGFLKNANNYRDSLALVVTKVNNRNGRRGQLISDEMTVKAIANFLSETPKSFIGKEVKNLENKLIIIDTILTNVNGTYSRIGLVREPLDEGPLLEIEAYSKSREKLRNMIYSEMEFSPVNQTDFGLSISDSSKLVYNDMVQTISNTITDLFDELCLNIESRYSEKITDAAAKLEDLQSGLDAHHNLCKIIENQSSEFSISVFFNWLDQCGVDYDIKMKEDFEKNNKLMYFLESVAVDEHQRQHQHLNPFSSRLLNLRLNLVALVQINGNRLEKLNDNYISGIVREVCEFIAKDLQTSIDSSPNDYQLQKNIKTASKLIQKWFPSMSQLPTEQMTFDYFQQELKKFLTAITVSVPAEFEAQLAKAAASIKTVKRVVGEENQDGQFLEWLQPFPVLQKYLIDVSDWFVFIEDLTEKLSDTDIQQDITTSFKQPYLKNWENLTNYLTSNNLKIKIERTTLNSFEQKTLDAVIKKVYDNLESTYFSASESIIKGHTIMTSKVRMHLENENQETSKVYIFASDSVIFDEDLNLEGQRKTLVVIAPKWVVRGNRIINLNGSAGKPLSQLTADCGIPGFPGQPGGSGGNFFGIGSEFVRTKKLTILANGGAGSAGQNGGEGWDGPDGTDPIPPTNEIRADFKTDICKENLNSGRFDVLSKGQKFRKYGTNGQKGRQGADGGLAGAGGKNGKIEIVELLNSSNQSQPSFIQKNNTVGQNGAAGIGGKGGKGGRNGVNYIVFCQWDWYSFFSYYQNVIYKISVEDTGYAPEGERGRSGKAGFIDMNFDVVPHRKLFSIAELYVNYIETEIQADAKTPDLNAFVEKIENLENRRRKRDIVASSDKLSVDLAEQSLLTNSIVSDEVECWSQLPGIGCNANGQQQLPNESNQALATASFNPNSVLVLMDLCIKKVFNRKNIKHLHKDESMGYLEAQAYALNIVKKCEQKLASTNADLIDDFDFVSLQSQLRKEILQMKSLNELGDIQKRAIDKVKRRLMVKE